MQALFFSLLLSATPNSPSLRVFIDAGHGTPNNRGNRGVHCEYEEVHTLQVAKSLGAFLSTKGMAVKLSRDNDTPSYAARLEAAQKWKADLLISIHSDARFVPGSPMPPAPAPDATTCLENNTQPGFSVLWSDEGTSSLKAQRHRLGQSMARQLIAAQFTAYHGADYQGLYTADAQPGGFIDAHPKALRIFLLRRPTMPSVIIETHHALDRLEVELWKKPETLQRFAAALELAIKAYKESSRSASP